MPQRATRCSLLIELLAVAAFAITVGCGSATQEPSSSVTPAPPASPAAPTPMTSFSQEITTSTKSLRMKANTTSTLVITVKNTGTQPWTGGNGGAGIVDASYRWLDDKGKTLSLEGQRAALTTSKLEPGQSDQLKLSVTAPSESGSYTLSVSMVQEGVDWFYLKGAKPLNISADIN